MGTKMGRGRVHGIHIAAQRKCSGLPNTLFKFERIDLKGRAKKGLFLRQKHDEKDVGQKCFWNMGQKCFWDMGQTRIIAEHWNVGGGHFLSETHNASLIWWIFTFAFLNLSWSWEFFPCLCQILLSTSFTLVLNSNFCVCLFLASFNCQANEQNCKIKQKLD